VEVEALLSNYSLGVVHRRNATAMEAQKGRGGASLGDGSLGRSGALSRWRRNRGAITTRAPSRWRRNRGGVEVEARQSAAQQMVVKPYMRVGFK
jgi:hypothetical protein